VARRSKLVRGREKERESYIFTRAHRAQGEAVLIISVFSTHTHTHTRQRSFLSLDGTANCLLCSYFSSDKGINARVGDKIKRKERKSETRALVLSLFAAKGWQKQRASPARLMVVCVGDG
jgi:hypothetical protein